MTAPDPQHRATLQRLARKAMLDRGLLPDFPPASLEELGRIKARAPGDAAPGVRDLRDLPWASIDNDLSLDLDQLTAAEALPGGAVRILVAVADVDGAVAKDSALDLHARHNTTSVYTAARLFPMLPDALSTGLTSLNCNADRLAVVVTMEVGADGSVGACELCRARVRSHAKLAYDSLAAWLEGTGAMPAAVAAEPGLDANLRLQDEVAQRMKHFRHEHGALSLDCLEARPVFDGDRLQDLVVQAKNRAHVLIEDFMIAANGATVRYLASLAFPSIRRVVRTPRRWSRLVELAGERGCQLPVEPDGAALEPFLLRQKVVDPLHFPELSLAVIKLLGPGEYLAQAPGDNSPGHFALAMKEYAHATAPNHRFSDLVTQRLVKAGLASAPCPYTLAELEELAARCTLEEDAATKVERQVAKSAAALLLEGRVGETFEGIVTGASAKGTWIRLLPSHIDGRLVHGPMGLDVGAAVRAKLVAVDVERGFIDLAATS